MEACWGQCELTDKNPDFRGRGVVPRTLVVHVSPVNRGYGWLKTRTLGERALVLKRLWTGYLFPPTMMMGLMLLVADLAIGFVQAAKLDSDPVGAADIGAWLGPLRFAGIALILTGVTLALATIVRSLRFQSDRVVQIAAGRQA